MSYAWICSSKRNEYISWVGAPWKAFAQKIRRSGKFKHLQCVLSTLVGLRTENKLGHVDTTGFADRRTEKAVSILHEHSMKFVHTHLQQARTPLYGEKVAMHNHLKSNFRKDGANQDRLVAQAAINNREVNCMRPHSMFDIKGQISDAPCILATALIEKKTSQEEYHVHTPCEAQQGKQSSSKPNSKVLVDVTNKFQVTTTPGKNFYCTSFTCIHI